MHKRDLSTAQRKAIRHIKDHRNDHGIHAGTLRVLERGQFINPQGELTLKGYDAYRYIMESGDGPEDLKAMFRW